MKLLLKNGADPNICNLHHSTPLHYATFGDGNSQQYLSYLLNDSNIDSSFVSDHGETTLELTIHNFEIKVANYLVKNG